MRGMSPRQRRIVYRSRQRGWLELDVLFGGWAARHVPGITCEEELGMVEELLEAETPEMLRWVMGQEDPPEKFDNKIMKSMREFASGEGNVSER